MTESNMKNKKQKKKPLFQSEKSVRILTMILVFFLKLWLTVICLVNLSKRKGSNVLEEP